MTPKAYWALQRRICGLDREGDQEGLPRDIRRLYQHLGTLPITERPGALNGFACTRDDPEEFVKALAEVDPNGPAPEAATGHTFATLADIARIVSSQPWVWPGWIASGVLNACAAEPGTGKTRFAADLARRIYHGLPWPDGQENKLPAGSRTLWIQGDRNFPEMLQVARDFGIPEEAWALGASPDDPIGGLDMDDAETLAALGDHIRASEAKLVVIDTVGMVTSRNLCRTEEAREFFGPILELAQAAGVAFLGLTHLSANKEALGRRIVEKARVVLKMTQPDPDGQRSRRRLWVDKTAVVKPPPLGISMKTEGNNYDFDPPSESEPNRGGRPAGERDKARAFIIKALSARNDRVGNDLRAEWEAAGGSGKTFWRSVDSMADAGDLVVDGGPGAGKQKSLHLVEAAAHEADAA